MPRFRPILAAGCPLANRQWISPRFWRRANIEPELRQGQQVLIAFFQKTGASLMPQKAALSHREDRHGLRESKDLGGPIGIGNALSAGIIHRNALLSRRSESITLEPMTRVAIVAKPNREELKRLLPELIRVAAPARLRAGARPRRRKLHRGRARGRSRGAALTCAGAGHRAGRRRHIAGRGAHLCHRRHADSQRESRLSRFPHRSASRRSLRHARELVRRLPHARRAGHAARRALARGRRASRASTR